MGLCVAEMTLRAAGLSPQRASAWGCAGSAVSPVSSAQPPAGPAAFFGVLGARLVLAKSCLDTDEIEIQISLREAYLQTCPAPEPASPARPGRLGQRQRGCVAGVKSARNDGV